MLWNNLSDTKNVMNGPNYKLGENLNNIQIFSIQFRDRSCYSTLLPTQK